MSEKPHAPARDIRDIGSGRGPKICKYCANPVPNRSRVRCDDCTADNELVTEVRRELARQKRPPLGVPAPSRGPMSKKRRRAEQAL